MNLWAILICMVMYCWMAFSNFRQKDYPHSFIWFSYAMSQGGFIWYEIIKKTDISP